MRASKHTPVHQFIWAIDVPVWDKQDISKMFGSSPTADDWVKLAKERNIRAAYELQQRGDPFKVWFDCEAERGDHFQHTNEQCLTKAFELALAALKGTGLYSEVEKVNDEFKRDFVYVEANLNAKWSIHLISTRYYFTSHEQAKLFGDHVVMPLATADPAWQWWHHSKKTGKKSLKTIIDCGVYTPNRQVRLEGQAKLKVKDWNRHSAYLERPFVRGPGMEHLSHTAFMTTVIDWKDTRWETIDDSRFDAFRSKKAPRVRVERSAVAKGERGERQNGIEISDRDWGLAQAKAKDNDFEFLGDGPDENGFFNTRNLVDMRECFTDCEVEHSNRPIVWMSYDQYTLMYACYDKRDRCLGRATVFLVLPDAKNEADDRDAEVFSADEAVEYAVDDQAEPEQQAVVAPKVRTIMDDQRDMCLGGARKVADWGTLLNHADLVAWAMKAYAGVNSVDGWFSFKDQLLWNMDRMYVYIGGTERRILYRVIEKGTKGEMRERWCELKGRDKGLEALLKPLRFKAWDSVDGKACKVGKPLSAATMWWGWDTRCTRTSTVLDPVVDKPRFDPKETFNLFRGINITKEMAIKHGDSENPVLKGFLEKIVRDVLCSGSKARYDYTLNCAAFMIQRVGRKLGTYICFWGMPGAGKGLFFHMISDVIGPEHCVHADSKDQVLNHFNDHLRNKLFLFMDEIDFKGAGDQMGTLRSLISEPERVYTAKGADSHTAPCYLNAGLATNNEPTEIVQVGERRAVVFDSNPVLGMNQWTQEERAAVWDLSPFHFARLLYERDISTFDPERLPPCDNLSVMTTGKPLACLWFVEAVEEGVVEPGEWYTVDELFTLYSEWMEVKAPKAHRTSSPKLMGIVATGWGLRFESGRSQEEGTRSTKKQIPVYTTLKDKLPALSPQGELKKRHTERSSPSAASGMTPVQG